LSSEERRAAIHEFSRGQRKEDASAVASRIKREPVSSRQESPKKDPPLKETQLLPPTPSNKPKPKAKAPEAKPAMKPEDNFIGK
jgi:cell division protein FtsN